MNRIYLDNAATSWPKPDTVYEAVDRYQRELGASAGRGAYGSAQQAQRIVEETRAACARLLGVSNAHQLVFTANGTASLNLGIHGLLMPGDHVVTTVAEHNSVLRPLHWQAENNGVDISFVDCDADGYVNVQAISEVISPKTRLVVVTHASNVTGAVQPIAEITAIAHSAGALMLVDAAQTAGCMPIDVSQLEVDLLACGGHKGLLGPLGTGLLFFRDGVEAHLRTICQGGTGVSSASPTQPDELPEKFEAGNLSLPAIAGLGAAADFLLERGVESVQQHHQMLTKQLFDGISGLPGVTLRGPNAHQSRVGVVSVAVEGYDPQEFAAVLDASCGIECRAGLHCAPKMHSALGSDHSGGLIRLSPGLFTTTAEIEAVLEAISALSQSAIL